MDMTPDGSPIIDKTHIDVLFIELRLELRRVQGRARLGLVHGPSDGDRPAA